MRIVTLMASLLVVSLTVIGIYYSPNLLNLGSTPDTPITANDQSKPDTPITANDQLRSLDSPEKLSHHPITQAEKEAYAREHLGYLSLVDRLPKGKPISPARALDADSHKRWEMLDGKLAQSQDERAQLLKAYHEKTRRFFVRSPGEGPTRGFVGEDSNDPEEILLGISYSNFVEQPGERANFSFSSNESLNRMKPDEDLFDNHNMALRDFLSPRRFGYVKDLEHVAGFESHGFRGWINYDPESLRLKVQHVELVGILRFEKPLVYLTQGLPSMEQVRQGKTRSLDYFEQVALPALCEGEDLYIVSKDDTIRMLGAIRATKTCQQCHDARIGDLLGAFSYTLRAAPNEK